MESFSHSVQRLSIWTLMLGIPLIVNYVFMLITYHKVHQSKERKVPPVLPSLLPSFENTIKFLYDSATFVRRATQYAGHTTCACITLGFKNIYFIQDPSSVAAMWRQPQLASPIYIYGYALKNVFGMPKSCLKAYEADVSGPYKKPSPGSNVARHNRVDFLTHESLVRAFSGPGLKPSFERFKGNFVDTLNMDLVENDWIENVDMLKWARDIVGKALVEAIFGKRLLELNPTFMEDLWMFDEDVPWLAKCLPHFMRPKAFNTRQRLLQGIKRWHSAARQEFEESKIYPDGDGDPVWGSYLMRERQQILTSVEGQNDEGLAAADLGLIWASVTNVTPSAMMMALHIWNDENLLSRIRHELPSKTSLSDADGTQSFDVELDSLDKLSVLNSVYAETLRCYVQAFITRGSAQFDLPIGSWWLPRSEIAMISSHVCHMDKNVWNTRNGEHPIDTFWSDRFLVKKDDKSSGPLKPEIRARMGLDTRTQRGEAGSRYADDDVYCDMRGLEGSWIPYGGGFGACPGKLITKRLMLWFCAYMATHYDVEILTKTWGVDDSRYGFGMQKPNQKIAFQLRKRRFKVV